MTKTVELMDVKELAAFLRCSPQWVYNEVSQRKRGESKFPMPLLRSGRHLWLKESIMDWLLQCNREANQTPGTANGEVLDPHTIELYERLGIPVQPNREVTDLQKRILPKVKAAATLARIKPKEA